MKRWIAGCLSLFVLMGPTHAATEQVFPSGDFEDPAGWTIGGEDGGMATIVPEAAREGKMGLRVADESDRVGSDCRSTPIPVTSGKTYELRFWGRNLSGSGIGVYLHFHDATSRTLNDRRPNQIISSLPQDRKGWHEFKLYGMAPAAAATLSVWIHSYNASKVRADYDGFQIAELSDEEAAKMQDENTRKILSRGTVTYEDFGAVGDGVADDMESICKAHTFANLHRLPVQANAKGIYHLGMKALTATVATNTDWGTARFTVDDSGVATKVESRRQTLFVVDSLLSAVKLELEPVKRDQMQVAARPEQDCYVQVESDARRVFIRRGSNQNKGSRLRDCFILRRDGAIEGPIDWDFDSYTRITARPIEQDTLVVKGGVFTTLANRMLCDKGYSYWGRNIVVRRSNTVIDGLTHYVVGETSVGAPYGGFLSASSCADITFRNCFATGHRTYRTIGSAGRPVSMGTYDYSANSVVNFRMENCRMNHINDRTLWGVIGTNFCKNIVLEDCVLSRMDSHQGVSGEYTIRRTTLGTAGFNAIGRGVLTVEDSTIYGSSLVALRGDYGSTWEGDVVIRNSRWVPGNGARLWPRLIGGGNDGMHDFGYPCHMPRQITIDGLFVDDSKHPDDYRGLLFFNHPEPARKGLPEKRPFPYQPVRKITIRNLQTASGKQPCLPNGYAGTEVEYLPDTK
ncbi:MAG: hypothetical protein HN742_06870 [Lentisphaerae bacterium]|nr:hypothetical protein [Lentisphaerota bacterium]MBT5605844.1 hypothetical protein [Lentisphaerota bacterium]MBT7055933.1 hypothetical protein [Lentisphaerota bacterium]MBT7841574.1 hypothetical protein [Lentisphaerota bacterium]